MNGHADIDTTEATEHLKNILNVGKKESDSAKLNSVVKSGMAASSGDGNLILNEGAYQTVNLNDKKDCSNVSIYGSDVTVYSSPLECRASRDQVIIDNMVDYGWEEKYYPGRLISIHLSGKYLAYVLRPSANKASYVRILMTNSDVRHLIKDFKSDVKDIAFAHSTSQVLLGSVDARGELFVHKIVDEDKTLLTHLLIRVTRPPDTKLSDNHRIIWCPYIPDDNDCNTEDNESGGEDVTTLLVVTHDEKAEIWNVETIVKEHGTGDVTTSQVKNGLQLISEHKLPISAATFSPDGTALAIASLDGDVKFFQVNTLNKDVSPKCLHQWTPHDGKPLSSLFFLDNHKNHKPDVQFWKFAITGADNNTELKLWSCETWTCLQTLRILPNPEDNMQPWLKADLDLSSKYLFLSDIKRKVLLIMMLRQEPLTSRAFICSLSEFTVPFAVLSLVVANVSTDKVRGLNAGKTSDDEGEKEDDLDNLNEVEENQSGYLMKLFWIHTKSLQSCRIIYRPKVDSPLHSIDSISSLSQDSFVYKDGLSDISLDIRDTSNRSVNDDLELSLEKELCGSENLSSQSCNTSLTSIPPHLAGYGGCGEVLLTPEDFTSPSHSTLTPGQNSFSHHDPIRNAIGACDSSNHLSESIDSLPIELNAIPRRKSSQHSANSSPSREVAEILAPSKTLQSDEIDDITGPKIKVDAECLNTSSLNVFPKSPESARQEYCLNDWPPAPDPSKEYRMASSNAKAFPSSDAGDTPSVTFDANAHNVLLKLGHSLDDLAVKVISLTDVLRDQRHEIQSLQNEIQILRQDQKHLHSNLHNLNSLDSIITNKVEHMFTQRLLPEYARLESLIVKRDKEDQQRSDRQVRAFSESVSTTFDESLEKSLKREIVNSVLPQMSSVLDSLVQQLQLETAQKLGSIDASLRESLTKHLKGKPFNDSLAQSVTASLHHHIQSACKEVFQNNVVPSFDKSCHHLFLQLNEIFKKGIVDYIQYFDKHSHSICTGLEATVSNVRDEIGKLVVDTKTLFDANVTAEEERNKVFLKQQEMLVTTVRQVVQEEVQRMFREQSVQAMNSRAVTPVPQGNPQVQKQQLLQLVKQGHINEAFQQALSAMDVQLVLTLCESVTLEQVFGPNPCPLKQHVLLSLVSQLSADLSVKTDIKIRYIEDVIASLDSSNPITREHIRSVLENLQQRITLFLQRNPNHKLCRNCKRIIMAIHSLI